MIERKVINKVYPLITMIIGFISFSISSIVTAFLSLTTNEAIIPILGIPLGAIIMTYLLKKIQMKQILPLIFYSIFTGMVAFLLGFLGGYVSDSIFNLIGLSEEKMMIISNTIVCILANLVFEIFFAYYYFGIKAIKIFALMGIIISIPFGILINSSINIQYLNTDLNLILFLISFGTSAGLSYGLYKNNDNVIKL